jgi:MFS family permease
VSIHNHASFAGLFFVQTLSRGILLSVIPLQALSLLGDAQRVSALFFAVSVGGILAALGMPIVIQRIGNYRSFLMGSVAMLVSAALLSVEHSVYFAIGLFIHVFSIAAVEVSLTLYILAQIPRRALTQFEPLRIFASVLALTIGPILGVYLEQRWSHNLPFQLSAVFAILGILYFRMLGMHKVDIPKSASNSINPLQYLRSFIHQPRLRLAYGLVLARSCWWTMFVIYTPIYAAQSGLGDLVGATIVSVGTAWTLTVPFWGWIGRKYGVRRLLKTGFVTTSALSLLVYFNASTPVIASTLLVFCALGATMLDGMGNVLFYRAVRGRERSEMTAVFATYRDTGQLATPGLYAVLLGFFTLPVVFLSASIWMLVASWYCRYIPARMR